MATTALGLHIIIMFVVFILSCCGGDDAFRRFNEKEAAMMRRVMSPTTSLERKQRPITPATREDPRLAIMKYCYTSDKVERTRIACADKDSAARRGQTCMVRYNYNKKTAIQETCITSLRFMHAYANTQRKHNTDRRNANAQHMQITQTLNKQKTDTNYTTRS